MKPTILLINFQDQQKLRKLKMALLPFKLRIKTIEPQDYSQPIGYLAGVKQIPRDSCKNQHFLLHLLLRDQR